MGGSRGSRVHAGATAARRSDPEHRDPASHEIRRDQSHGPLRGQDPIDGQACILAVSEDVPQYDIPTRTGETTFHLAGKASSLRDSGEFERFRAISSDSVVRNPDHKKEK